MITTNKHVPVLLDEIKKFIPKSKKMLLHVGPFVYGKGIIEILDSFKTLREKYDVDFHLLFFPAQ